MNIRKSISLLIPFIAVTAASSCVDKSTYYGIDRDIEIAASKITDEDELVHFFGGIVRLGEFLIITLSLFLKRSRAHYFLNNITSCP